MTESELKERMKTALSEAGLSYSWLAERLGITKCTLNNYMARKPIPAGQWPLMEEILQRLESGDSEILTAAPLKKKRHRRTNEQIRKDMEESMRLGQEKMAVEGYDDTELAERKWKELGQQVLDKYRENEEMLNNSYATRQLFDMNAELESQVSAEQESVIYRIAVPVEIVDIYQKEVDKIKNMGLDGFENVNVPALISRAITEDAKAMTDCYRPFFIDKLQAFKDRWNKLNQQTDNL